MCLPDLAFQSDTAQRIAKALHVEVLAAEQRLIAKVPTKSFAAYNLYLQGRAHYYEYTEEGLAGGREGPSRRRCRSTPTMPGRTRASQRRLRICTSGRPRQRSSNGANGRNTRRASRWNWIQRGGSASGDGGRLLQD